MKLRLCLAFALSLLLATHTLAGDEPPQKAPPTVSVPLEYLDAAEAYQKLRADFPKIAEMVQDIQIRTNTLTLNPAHPQYDELRQKLAKIDVRPTQVLLQAVISETQPDGTERVLSEPSVMTLAGNPASIVLGARNGRGGLKITIRPFTDPKVLDAMEKMRKR